MTICTRPQMSALVSPMGFLLDQPESYGPVYIAEIDEDGSARQLLKHPSIMLKEGVTLEYCQADACCFLLLEFTRPLVSR